MPCNVQIGVNGRIVCERSLVGCLRSCPWHPDYEKAKVERLARPPLYERRLDVTDAVNLPWDDRDRDVNPAQKAATKKRRVKELRSRAE